VSSSFREGHANLTAQLIQRGAEDDRPDQHERYEELGVEPLIPKYAADALRRIAFSDAASENVKGHPQHNAGEPLIIFTSCGPAGV